MTSGKRVTLREIAKQADTSAMAVSVALNGSRSNTRISPATRRRIVEVATHLNYSPNAMAQGLKRQRTQTLGVLFPGGGSSSIHSMYAGAVLDGIVNGAATAGYHILLYNEPWRSTRESATLFADRRVDGIIVVTPKENSDVIAGLKSLGIPVGVLSSITNVPGVPYVAIDNQTGVRLALNHLRDLGHTRIAFMGHRPDRVSMRERYTTYREWMQEQGFPTPTEYLLIPLEAGKDTSNTRQLEQMLGLPNRPTAILAVTDDFAAEVIQVAQRNGVSVPEQLSVVGFDDVLIASLTVPKITTLRLPLLEMGQQITRLLIENIEEGGVSANPSHVTIPELIIRDSTTVAPRVFF